MSIIKNAYMCTIIYNNVTHEHAQFHIQYYNAIGAQLVLLSPALAAKTNYLKNEIMYVQYSINIKMQNKYHSIQRNI
jgi:hypothetical protein